MFGDMPAYACLFKFHLSWANIRYVDLCLLAKNINCQYFQVPYVPSFWLSIYGNMIIHLRSKLYF